MSTIKNDSKKKEVEGLHRFGDTSFRIANQINFYTEVINKIIEYKTEDGKIDSEKIYKKLIEDEVINYSDGNIDRCSILMKLFAESLLLEQKGGNIYHITERFKDIIDYLSERDNTICNYSDTEILFCYILLLNKNHGERLKEFLKYLQSKINSGIETTNELELVSFIHNGDFNDTIKQSKQKSKIDFLKKLYKMNFNETNLKKFLCEFSKINGKTKNNENEKKYNYLKEYLKKEKSIISFRKPPTTIFKSIELLNFINDGNFKNIVTNYLHNGDNVKDQISLVLKLFYKKEYRDLTKHVDEIVNLFKQHKYKLFVNFLLVKKYQLYFIEYMDINLRWFKNIGLLNWKNNGNSEIKEYLIDKRILKLFNYVIENNLEKNNFIDFAKEIRTKFNFIEERVDKYPFTHEQLVQIINDYKDNKHAKIYEEFEDLKNRGNSTIYEYLVNLAFAYSYDYSVDDFRTKYCRTGLDNKFLPTFTAPGRGPDGFIEDIDNGHTIFSTIESTTHKKLEAIVTAEKNRIHRHSYEYCTKNKQDDKIVMFVVDVEMDKLLLQNFCSWRMSAYCNNPDVDITVILLTTDIFLELFKTHRLNRVIRSFMNRIPINDDEFAREKDILKWYRQQMESIRR